MSDKLVFRSCGQGTFVFGDEEGTGMVVLVHACCYYRAVYALASVSREPRVCIAWFSHHSQALDNYKDEEGMFINTFTGEEWLLYGQGTPRAPQGSRV
jgi:hypothetical protein